jgi:glutathione S-transferase
MAKVEILGLPQSNYVWATRIALAEKGVDYDLKPAPPHSPELNAIHPLGKMPALRHGDVTLFESNAILTYIDKAFPGPALAPTDALGAAQVQQWISLVNTAIDPTIIRAYVLAYVFPSGPDKKPDRARIDAAVPNIEKQMDILDRAVEATGYLVGSSFTLADINLLPIVAVTSRFPESSAALDKRANLKKYLETHFARPSVRGTAPPSA